MGRASKPCTCGAQGAEFGDPHREGCPRYRDRSKSQAVITALRRRYDTGDGEWLLWEEVWSIDAFALRCWSAGIGNRRVAFEVKTSRADFLTEIRKPAKRQNALDLSHQYFFATPKGLVDKSEIPSECGLMEVDAKGRTKTVVKAPVREPRGLKMSEAVYLMRQPLYRGGLLQLRREVLHHESTAHGYREMVEGYKRDAEAAETRLEEHAAHMVTEGSTWIGMWRPYSWVPGEPDVPVYVEQIETGWYGHEREEWRKVHVRRLDGKEVSPWTFYRFGEFLRRFTPHDPS